MTEQETILAQLKDVLPEMVRLKASLEGHTKTAAEVADLKAKIDSISGDILKVSKSFTDYMGLEKSRRSVSDKLDDEQQLDFIKFFIAVFKQGKGPHTSHEAIIQEIQDKYPAKSKAMSEGSSVDGGYVIPTLYSKYIWRAALQASVALSEAQMMPLTKGFKLPLTRIGTDVSVYWETEAADISSHVSSPVLAQSDLTAKKLMGHVIFSNELLEDEPSELMDEVGSTSLIDWAANLFGEAMGQEIDNQAFNGTSTFVGILRTTGVNKLIMNHGDGSFSDVNFDYLSKLISLVLISQTTGAKFFLSQSMLHVVRTLKDTYGQYVWQAPTGGEPGTIWGYPYRVCEKMPALTSSAVSTPFMFFGNMKKYAIGTKGNITLKLDSSIKSFNDQSVLFVRRRIAMVTALPAAFAVLSTNSAQT